MKLGEITVVFDDGRTFTAKLKPSDLIHVEEDLKTSVARLDTNSLNVTMRLAWYALRRQGDPIPEDFYVFVDEVNLEELSAGRAEGKPSGQAASIGE